MAKYFYIMSLLNMCKDINCTKARFIGKELMIIKYREHCKLIMVGCRAILYKETKTIYVCNSKKDKETSYKQLCAVLPPSEIKSNCNYRIEFANGSSIECLIPDELKTVRGKRSELKPYVNYDPYELYCLDNKTIDEILCPLMTELKWWQKLRMKFDVNRKYVSSKNWRK